MEYIFFTVIVNTTKTREKIALKFIKFFEHNKTPIIKGF
jgi:hypothetical protein